jgi:serine protease Do
MKRWPLLLALVLGSVVSYFVGPLLHGQAPVPPNVPKELTSYRDIVKRVLPAVVSVDAKAASRTKVKQQTRGPAGFDGAPFTATQEPRSGFGSGFIVDAKGMMVTNFHVVEGADQVTVTLIDGRKFVSKDIRGDRRSDLALIRIDIKDNKPLAALEFADSDAMEIGDRVLAFGAPFGLTGSVTSGIVSAKGRSGLAMNMYEDFLQTDAAVNPGNSGGPLVNLEGKVIGVTSAIKSRSGGFQGVGLAIASNLARSVLKALETEGVVRRGYLGIQIHEVTENDAAVLGLDKGVGVLVGSVFDNTPAAKAGLKTGDCILALGGKNVKDGRSFQALVAALPLGKAVNVTVIRDAKSRIVPVTIEEQPDDFGVRTSNSPPAPGIANVAKLGLELADLTDQLAQELGYKIGTKGVVITRVEAGSAAAGADLRRGMLLLKIDRQPVAISGAARDLFDNASVEKGILLQVYTPQSGTNFVLMQAMSQAP